MKLYDFDSARQAPDAEAPPQDLPSQRQIEYWRRNCRLSLGLLLVWAGVAFGLIFYARELSFSFFGWPFSFWVAAQGALLVFCLIVAFYARAMRRLDALYADLATDG